MVAVVLSLTAILLVLIIARISDGEGTAAIVAHLFLKFLAGAAMLVVLALVLGLIYILLCTPHSVPI